jgi:hypothetical protein
MAFTQNSYWGSAAVQAGHILWDLLWDQHAFIFGLLYIFWKIYQQWHGGGMGAVMTHITDSVTAVKGSILPICKALLIAFLLIMFVWVPYSRQKETDTVIKSLETDKTKIETAKNILETENKTLQTANQSLQDSVDHLKQGVAKTELAKQKEDAAIAKRCWHNRLEFTQKRLENFQSSESVSNYEYVKEVRIKTSISALARLKIHMDDGVGWFHTMPRDKEYERFNGGIGGGDYVEVLLSPKVLEDKNWSVWLYAERPFNVVCIESLRKKPVKQQ